MPAESAGNMPLREAARAAMVLILALLLGSQPAGVLKTGSSADVSLASGGTLLIEGSVRQHDSGGPGLGGVMVAWECVQHPDLHGETTTSNDGSYQLGPIIFPDIPVTVYLSASHEFYELEPFNGYCIWYSGGDQRTQADFVAYAHTPTPTPPLHTPTPTITPILSPTPTSTSQRPTPPRIGLIGPADCSLLPQPLAPTVWVFEWSPPYSYGWYQVHISGPGGRTITSPSFEPFTPAHYSYTTTQPIPNDALGPWEWYVDGSTWGGYTSSETRRFWVMPPPGEWRIDLPVLLRNWLNHRTAEEE